MAVTTVNIPAANLVAPAAIGTEEQVNKVIKRGLDNYGQYFKFASNNSKLPMEMLLAFAAVESGIGKMVGPAGHATRGIMQWNRQYAKTQLENEYKLGRMTPDEKDYLAKNGIKFDKDGKTRVITEADQMKPGLNILIGSILLGMYADSYIEGKQDKEPWGTDENGNLRIDRMIAVYNAGAYGDTGKKARFGKHKTPQELAGSVNSTTAGYIRKLLGKNGYYDYMLQPDIQAYIKAKNYI